ncbi:hypothetical protein MRB53_033157 [Persea americana]|uniref:Uncharacterized protein n=1 Tax=Persea americana TaxID=3435 RepID=A0ACC2KTV5_PERAE|nr:hypothetical protein MRB53_033157 [Persea americana]
MDGEVEPMVLAEVRSAGVGVTTDGEAGTEQGKGERGRETNVGGDGCGGVSELCGSEEVLWEKEEEVGAGCNQECSNDKRSEEESRVVEKREEKGKKASLKTTWRET